MTVWVHKVISDSNASQEVQKEEIRNHLKALIKGATHWIFGWERCPSTGLPHLQGYAEYKHQIRFSTLCRQSPNTDFRKANGTREENQAYCSKDKNIFMSNLPPLQEEYRELLLDKYKDVEWQQWQEYLLNKLKEPVDDREIVWCYDELGCSGKSFLAKYIDLKYDVVIASGKANDIFNQLDAYYQRLKRYPTIVLVDVPRVNSDFISYQALEKLKDGHLYSGKYEGGKHIFLSPHVIVFANCEPKEGALSEDRVQLVTIKPCPLPELSRAPKRQRRNPVVFDI